MGAVLRFIKEWILPIAMIIGALAYRWVSQLAFLTPYLIFFMLLITFSKISWREIRLSPAHGWLLGIQLFGSLLCYFLIRPYNELIAQGALLCMLAPTATAAAVITGMLGGNVGFLTSYLIFCNVAVAIAAPLYFSLIGVDETLTFLQSVLLICRKVFPLLILPLITAFAFRKWVPPVHRLLIRIPRLTFYLWVVALIVVTGITVKDMSYHREHDLRVEIGLGVVSCLLCGMQFFLGRRIGAKYGDAISSGQGLGQKNTVLALWMAQTYLNPVVALAPAGYILWQNIINSYQLLRKSKMSRKGH